MSSTNSSINIPYANLSVNQRCNYGDQFLKIVKALVTIVCMVLISLFVVYLMKDQSNSKASEGRIADSTALQCFHCITNRNGNLSQPSITTDADCQDNPTHILQCKEGDVCWKSWFQIDDTFIRSCMPLGKHGLGCHNITKPYYTKACYCDKPLCL